MPSKTVLAISIRQSGNSISYGYKIVETESCCHVEFSNSWIEVHSTLGKWKARRDLRQNAFVSQKY